MYMCVCVCTHTHTVTYTYIHVQMSRDLAFLQLHNLMDYSMFIGVHKRPVNSTIQVPAFGCSYKISNKGSSFTHADTIHEGTHELEDFGGNTGYDAHPEIRVQGISQPEGKAEAHGLSEHNGPAKSRNFGRRDNDFMCPGCGAVGDGKDRFSREAGIRRDDSCLICKPRSRRSSVSIRDAEPYACPRNVRIEGHNLHECEIGEQTAQAQHQTMTESQEEEATVVKAAVVLSRLEKDLADMHTWLAEKKAKRRQDRTTNDSSPPRSGTKNCTFEDLDKGMYDHRRMGSVDSDYSRPSVCFSHYKGLVPSDTVRF